MRFSMILEMVDKFSAPAKRAKAGVGGLIGAVREVQGAMRKARSEVLSGARSVEHFDRRARRLRRVALGRTFQAIGAGARQMTRNLDMAVARLRLTERAAKAAKRGLRGLGGRLAGAAPVAATAAVGGGFFAAFDTLRTTGQFEQYQIMLEGIEGSAGAARKSIEWVQKFTSSTPYELEQVMEAFVALKAYGIDPLNGSLTALGDGAAGMSKPLMQAIEALADATTGEFERLKEFGIRASKEGNKVAFTFRQSGKDIRREADFTGAAIEEALVGIFNDRFGGGMQRQSETLFGIISNLKDRWTGFQLQVGEAGIFATVKKDLQALLKDIDAMSESGELAGWAKDISDGLEDAWGWGKKFVKETDWKAVGAALIFAVETLTKMVALLGRVITMANEIAAGEWFGFRRVTGTDARAGVTGNSPEAVKGSWFNLRREGANDNMAPARLGSIGVSSLSPRGGPSVRVSGKHVIEVLAAPGLTARTRSHSASGSDVPSETRVGRTMRTAS